jgi:phosphoribosylamine---glycine ligase
VKHLKVLIVGNGAREHAIAWKLAQSKHEPVLYVAPGNAGMDALGTGHEMDACSTQSSVQIHRVNLAVNDIGGLVAFAKKEEIGLVVIGPEQPLANGLVDACIAADIPVFGPTRAAAELESSKAFAKEIMNEAGVPTAEYHVFHDPVSAKAFITDSMLPIVIKADGLAAGKGVVIAQSKNDAISAIDEMMVNGQFGSSGNTVVIEEFMRGTEVSLMFFVDKGCVRPMLPARDHKRIFDGDRGPNTGGMGAFAPVTAFVEAGLTEVVQAKIVEPTLHALANRKIGYQGVLYVGLMISEAGPKVVEFNARFGDPETEVVLPLLSSDLLDIMWAVAHNTLSDVQIEWKNEAAVCVVLAAKGYPASPESGDVITIPGELPESAVLFHAGVKMERFPEGKSTEGELVGQPGEQPESQPNVQLGEQPAEQSADRSGKQSGKGPLVTAGGRVITVSATGDTIESALAVAYQVVETVNFSGKQFRHDIANNQSL